MIELNDEYLYKTDIASSKGNQLKWCVNDVWYKADSNGYEGLSEYIVSKLLIHSSLNSSEYIDYCLDQVKYKKSIMNACKSSNFLAEGDSIITIKRLLDTYNSNFFDTYDSLVTIKEKAKYLVDTVIGLTGLKDFGEYIYKLAVIDGLFLNEDRHFHNIAVIQKKDNTFDYCPIFDNGASLLSDVKLDYPISENTIDLIKSVKSKTFDCNFNDVIDSLEELYACNITFSYTEEDINNILKEVTIYDEDTIKRVKQVLIYQRNKYQYFFD